MSSIHRRGILGIALLCSGFSASLYAAEPYTLDGNDLAFSREQIAAYTTVGGAPHLDGAYTVFGEVTEGMDVIDKIQAVKTNRADRPETDVRILKATVIE